MRSLVAALAAILLCAAPAGAAIIQLFAVVDGAQAAAGAGTGSSATGTMSITLDDSTNQISWSGSFAGLGSPFLVAHFHGPALPNQGAGVALGTAVVTSNGGLDGTSVGNATISAQQAADLANGLWYWNVHSTTFTGGEIRGNLAVVPEPGTGLLVGGGMLGLALRRRR